MYGHPIEALEHRIPWRDIPLKIGRDRIVIVGAYVSPFAACRWTAAVVTPLRGLPGHGAERAKAQLAARSLKPTTHQSPAEPLRLPDSALERGGAHKTFTTLVFGFIAACLALGIISDSLWSRLSR